MPAGGWNVRIQEQEIKNLLQFPSEGFLRRYGQKLKTSFAGTLPRNGSIPSVPGLARTGSLAPERKPPYLEVSLQRQCQGNHPNPANCLGQAPHQLSAGLMQRIAEMATNYFRKSFAARKISSLSFNQTHEFHSLLPSPRLAAFLWVSMWVRLRAGEGRVSYQSTV
jgi:hypothetical protein